MAIVIQEALDADIPRACEMETAAYGPANLGAVCTYASGQTQYFLINLLTGN